jgi:hypothetical protein
MRIAKLMYLTAPREPRGVEAVTPGAAHVERAAPEAREEVPALSVNPLGLALSVFCAAMLVIMLIGFGPLSRLTNTFGQVYLGGNTKSVETASVK